MNQLLKKGERIRGESTGGEYVVETYLGGGGQGEVYRVRGPGGPFAAKWMFKRWLRDDPGYKARLEGLVRMGNPDHRFLWPLEALESPRRPGGVGYLMPLRDPRFVSVPQIMRKKVEPSFRSLTTAGINLASAFRKLHSLGRCYRDISHNNVFLDPADGQILICDNDNVVVNRQDEETVGGTPKYMAPEIVRGDAPPSTSTDLYSLAVLLFWLYMMHHPLDGEREAKVHCLDAHAMQLLYGTKPVFIFDPHDHSNRPRAGVHENALIFWPLYPEFLKQLFIRSFTKGLSDPENGRVLTIEWEKALARLRDSILPCSGCGAEHFYDADQIAADGAYGAKCWNCGRQLVLPPRLRVGNWAIILSKDAKLYPYHLDSGRNIDGADPVGELTQHPKDPTVWGLRNLGLEAWSFRGDDNRIRSVDKGEALKLQRGLTIQFGTATGEIRA